jgi:hypothetical protein
VSNLYAPPKAALGDLAAPLSRSVRGLRAVAVIGSALIGLAPFAWWVLFPETRQFESLVYAACYFVLSALSLAALLSPSAERAVSGTALVLNGLALTFLAYILYARRDVAGTLPLIIPTLLNLAAIYTLARAREA